jgi:integrase
MNERVKYASETTCNIELKTLRSSFNIAIKLGEINENPANAVKQFIVPEKTNFCFSNEEITQLLNVMGNHFIRNVTLLAIYTGARRGEIANLQWQDIDFENRVIHIRNKETFTTKTRKERDIPISDDLHLLLQELRGIKDESNLINFRNPEDYVIAKNEGGKYSGSHLSRLFKRFLRKAGLDEKYHLHIIRHYAQSTLSNKNVPIYQIQQISGSSNLTTTLGYLHTRMEDLRKAVNLIKVN